MFIICVCVCKWVLSILDRYIRVLFEWVCVRACLLSCCVYCICCPICYDVQTVSFIYFWARAFKFHFVTIFSLYTVLSLSVSIYLSVCLYVDKYTCVCVCMSGLSTYTQPHLPVFHFEFTPLIVCLYKNKSVAGSISLIVTSVDKKVPKQSMKMIMQMKGFLLFLLQFHIFCDNNSFGCVNIYLP